jgi:plasmid stability protein
VLPSPRSPPGDRAGAVVGQGNRNASSDIMIMISREVVMEQILIRNLPAGTKAALRARAKLRHRSVEAEARDVLTRGLVGDPVTIVDLLGTDDGADIEFEPERLGLTARSAQL